MKKLLVLLLISLSIFTISGTNVFSECTYSPENGGSIGSALDACLEDAKLVNGKDVAVDGGFPDQIKKWTNNISLYLGVFAVLSIVVGSLMLTFSAGEEDKVKKAKDVVKWGIIGFLGVVTASAIIHLVVKIIYSI